MPQVLMELMRHSKIETTMRFYVGRNAESTAKLVWGLSGDTSGDTHPRLANVLVAGFLLGVRTGWRNGASRFFGTLAERTAA